MTNSELPSIPWEPQVPREEREQWSASCALCHSEYDAASEADAERLVARMGVDAMLNRVRELGYVVYKKRPHMRAGKVRLANGTVLVQTSMEEVTSGE